MHLDKTLWLHTLRSVLPLSTTLVLIPCAWQTRETFFFLGPAMVLSAIRTEEARAAFLRKRLLRGQKFGFELNLAQLKQYTRSNAVYLGIGFIWEKEHTEKLHALLESHGDIAKPMADPNKRGQLFMQELAPNKDLYIPLEFLNGHTLIAGTTGAGKTRLFDVLIAQAVLRGEAVIILDPKGDRALKEHAQTIASEQDPNNFLFFHPGFPEESVGLNPIFNFTRTTELAGRLAQLVPTAKGGNDPFRSFAQLTLNVIIGGLLLIGKRPTLKLLRYYADGRVMELGFQAFRSYLEGKTPAKAREELAALLKSTSKVPGRLLATYNTFYRKYTPVCPELEALYALSRHDSTHYGKMIATMMPLLDTLTSGSLGDLLTPPKEPDFNTRFWDFERVIDQRKVLYIGLDALTDPMAAGALGSLFLADLAATAGNRYNYHQGAMTPVNIFVDEAAEIANEQLVQLLNKGRGAGFRLFVATQTVPDFEARLGSPAKARQVLGNMNNLISLRIIDPETCKYCAETLPEVRVRFRTESAQSAQDSEHLLKVSTSRSESASEEKVPLIGASSFINLPDLEYIARIGAATVYKGRLPFLKLEA